VYLEVEFRRVACRNCGLVKQEKLTWIADVAKGRDTCGAPDGSVLPRSAPPTVERLRAVPEDRDPPD
jgi:hypothetical protein